MTIEQFKRTIYIPTIKQVNGKKAKDMSDKERMIIAMGQCTLAIDDKQFKETQELEKLLIEIGESKRKNPQTRMDIIEEQARVWRVDKTKLCENLKKVFMGG